MSVCDPIGIILLGAGSSERFGARNKLTSPFQKKPLICHIAHALSAAKIGPIYVVTGHQSQSVLTALAPFQPHQIHNHNHKQGIAHSIAAGVLALRDDYDHLMIALGDTPHITQEHIRKLAQTHLASTRPQKMITRPLYAGIFGHPVIWGADHFEALSSLSGDKGGQHLITAANSVHVCFDEPLAARDYDHEADFL